MIQDGRSSVRTGSRPIPMAGYIFRFGEQVGPGIWIESLCITPCINPDISTVQYAEQICVDTTYIDMIIHRPSVGISHSMARIEVALNYFPTESQ
jgi:hypothetical protein